MSTLITVAPTGAETEKSAVPQLPTTLEDIVDTARRIESAGAAMIHLHFRDGVHGPTLDLEVARDWVGAVREATDLVVQVSTGGSITDTLADRLAILDIEPDSCSLSMGTMNFGSGVFQNPPTLIRELFITARDREIVPEFELFDIGHIEALRRLLETEGLPFNGKVHCDLVLGVPGGMPGTPEMVTWASSRLPAVVTSWTATGVGRTSIPVMLTTLACGGHLRVGMEDTLTLSRGVPVTHNEQLVERAAELAALAQRPAMTTQGARELLGIRA